MRECGLMCASAGAQRVGKKMPTRSGVEVTGVVSRPKGVLCKKSICLYPQSHFSLHCSPFFSSD